MRFEGQSEYSIVVCIQVRWSRPLRAKDVASLRLPVREQARGYVGAKLGNGETRAREAREMRWLPTREHRP